MNFVSYEFEEDALEKYFIPASEVGFTVRMMGCLLSGEAKWICGSDSALLTDGKDGTLWVGWFGSSTGMYRYAPGRLFTV